MNKKIIILTPDVNGKQFRMETIRFVGKFEMGIKLSENALQKVKLYSETILSDMENYFLNQVVK